MLFDPHSFKWMNQNGVSFTKSELDPVGTSSATKIYEWFLICELRFVDIYFTDNWDYIAEFTLILKYSSVYTEI